jgi:hypothetical protein
MVATVRSGDNKKKKRMCSTTTSTQGRDTHRLRRFSSEKGSASLESFLIRDLPRAMRSEDWEPAEERGDEGGPWVLDINPPFSSACSVDMDGLTIVHFACG